MDRRGTVFLLEITPEFFHEVRSEFVRPLLLDQFDRMQLRFFTMGDRDLLLGDHAVNGVIAPGQRFIWMQDRRIVRRRARNRREHRRFFDIQVLELLAEVIFRRRRKTVLSAAHINKVAVHGEDLLLGVVTFDLDG